MTFRLPHLVAALALHVLLLGLMVSGVQCSGKTHRTPVINAVLLDPSRQELAQQKRREQQRREEEARRTEQKQLAEAAARKKKEDEARKARLAADQKKAAEQRKAAEQKKVTEKQRAEAQTRLAAEERARLAAVMAAEETQRAADRAAGERDARLAEWAIALTRHVARNWVRPSSATGDFECRVRMQLLPDGTVTNAKIEKSCGSAQLDRSVEDAVYRASPLPKPSDPSVFDRDLTIRFVPES